MDGRTLDWIALGMLIFVMLTIIYGVIFIHDIPYEIARKRKHPHQDAIHTAGWVSLFLMHTIWPFLWIWATLYKPGFGWGLKAEDITEQGSSRHTNGDLVKQLDDKIQLMDKEREEMKKEYDRKINLLARHIKNIEQQRSKQEGN